MISRLGRVSFGVGVSGALVFACTPSIGDDVVLVGDPPLEGPRLASPDASVDDASNQKPLLCPSNECPSPLLTCGSSTYLCDVDPLTDNLNCGACGNVCAPYVEPLGGGFACLNGACALICDYRHEDCDGILDNGCETEIWTNENCSACNDACTSPDTCKQGVCLDCYPPTVHTECGCRDLASEDHNCGACGVACNEHPAGRGPAPPNAYYGCGAGTCDRLKCDNREGTSKWSDCNGDLNEPNGDGCEIDLNRPAVDNCGGCNVQCAPGQACGVSASGGSGNVECLCGPGEVNCGAVGVHITCANLDSDIQNCGACGRDCPAWAGSAGHGQKVCRAGSCGVSCDLGWADCNGFDADGCETNVHQDPANCGSCGHPCDGGASQACVGGRCVVEDCEEKAPL